MAPKKALGFQKTVCPLTRDEFNKKADEIIVVIAGREFNLEPREFSTGSLGWNLNEKVEVKVNGKTVKCQVGLNVTVIGSKEV